MRQIALDTETTGLLTEEGHRVIEIGCIEVINRKITGNHFHCYIDPEREVDPGAFAIHGISNDFLRSKPKFAEVVDQLVTYIDGAELIIHNAPFDVGFLNYEFSLVGHPKQIQEYCAVFDTLLFARQRHPGQKNNLDALCKRYEIDNSHRQLHGALLDADLLARIYLAMTGGQGTLFSEDKSHVQDEPLEIMQTLTRNKPLPVTLVTAEDQRAHLEFVEILKQNSGDGLWEED